VVGVADFGAPGETVRRAYGRVREPAADAESAATLTKLRGWLDARPPIVTTTRNVAFARASLLRVTERAGVDEGNGAQRKHGLPEPVAELGGHDVAVRREARRVRALVWRRRRRLAVANDQPQRVQADVDVVVEVLRPERRVIRATVLDAEFPSGTLFPAGRS
jgi:hypothetical protein